MSEASPFRVNQTGYAGHLPIWIAALSPDEIRVTDGNGRTVFSLPPQEVPLDEASGDRVRLLRLNGLTAGEYTIRSGEKERRFQVQKRPWQSLTNALIKGLYYQRCGCGLRPEHAGFYAHPPCHTAPALDWEDRTVSRTVTGGWHDAGDYGKYVGPGAAAAAHLMYAFLLFPDGCADPLGLPETGNGLPDILNEARFELDWLLQMQRRDGAFHHKLTKARFAPFIMPQDDKEQEFLMPVSHCATAAACACLALAARVYLPYDTPFAGGCLQAARFAWEWLQEHPDFVPFQNPEGVRTGQYGDRSDRDERFWAACELYAATGEASFRQCAEALFPGQRLTQFGWANVGGLGAICCLFSLGEAAGPVLYGQMREAFLAQSEEPLRLSRLSGYGTALAADRYIWGSILPILSGAMAMILHWLLTGREEMRDAALTQWHYALGMNALDTCFVTGFGERSVLHPHHRPSGADGIDAPVPGLVSGGPNQRFPYPATREKLGESTPPAKYFLDETPSADTNEIAVYWNSPAVFVAAFLNSACALSRDA